MTEREVTAARDLQISEILAISIWYPGKEFSRPPDLNKAIWHTPGPPVIPAIILEAIYQLLHLESWREVPVHEAAWTLR